MYKSIFLGKTRELSEKISSCYNNLCKEDTLDVQVEFEAGSKSEWEKMLPDKEKVLVFYELTESTAQAEKEIINAIHVHNTNLEWVLLADTSIDYFEIASYYKIGNILKKDMFDTSIIRALTIRLLSGKIFGFEPYFPNGFSHGPTSTIIEGHVVINDVMQLFQDDFLSRIPERERYRVRTYFYELLINAVSYTVVGLTSEERDEGFYSTPSEIDIPDGQKLQISMALDDEKSGFSIVDPSGSLTLDRVLSKLRRQSKIGDEEHPPGIWDLTGRGLSLVSKDNRLIVNILREKMTEIIFLHYKSVDLNKYESIIVAEVANTKNLPEALR